MLAGVGLPGAGLAACGGDPRKPQPVAHAIQVDYPADGSIFPSEFVPPRFLWHDEAQEADAWRIEIRFADGGTPLTVETAGPLPPPPTTDCTASRCWRSATTSRANAASICWRRGLRRCLRDLRARAAEEPGLLPRTRGRRPDPLGARPAG